jgi:hypothetical protein
VFSKFFQKALFCRLNQLPRVNSILSTEKYGFRKGLSTGNTTLSLTDNLIMAWNKRIQVGGIFCDLTKLLAVSIMIF